MKKVTFRMQAVVDKHVSKKTISNIDVSDEEALASILIAAIELASKSGVAVPDKLKAAIAAYISGK